MLRSRLVVVFMISNVLSLGQAWACIGNGEAFSVGFRETANKDELIAIVTETKYGTSREIIDDTGYIGLHLGITKLVKQADADSAKTVSKSDVVTFTRARLDSLMRYLKKNTQDPTQTNLLTRLSALDLALVDNPISTEKLQTHMREVNSAFYQEKVEILASFRESSSNSFGPEVPFMELKLPTYLKSRSMGCNAGLEGFNTVPAKASTGRSSSQGGSANGGSTSR